MISFIEQAQVYATYHQKITTRYSHMIGIPLLFLSFMILCGFVHLVVPGVLDIQFAEIGTVLLLGYYFRLNWRLALAVTPILLFLLWISHLFSYQGPTAFALWSFIICFVLGASAQLAGYVIEGKQPAFLHHLGFILIAPLCLIAEAFFMAGWMDNLKEEIHGDDPKSTRS